MSEIIIYIFILILLIWISIYKKEYIIALFLEGHIFLKLIEKFSLFPNKNISFIVYFGMISIIIFKIQKINEKEFLRIFSVYGCFIFFLYLSTFYSLDKEYGKEKLFSFILISFPILLFTFTIIKDRNSYKKLLRAISNLAILTGIITLCCIYKETGKFSARIGTTEASEIKFLGVNLSVAIWFGRRMVLGFIASIILMFLEKNKREKNLLKAILLFIFSVLSISRGPILSLSIIILLIIFNKRKKIFNNKIFITIFIIVFMSFFGLIFYKMGNSFIRLFKYNDGNASSRLEALKKALDNFINFPILGIGLGGYNSINPQLKYPHNVVIEILVELGLIGSSIIGTIILILFINYYKYFIFKVQRNQVFLFTFYTFLFSFINGLVSGNLVSNEYIFFSVVLFYVSKKILKKEKRRREIESKKDSSFFSSYRNRRS